MFVYRIPEDVLNIIRHVDFTIHQGFWKYVFRVVLFMLIIANTSGSALNVLRVNSNTLHICKLPVVDRVTPKWDYTEKGGNLLQRISFKGFLKSDDKS